MSVIVPVITSLPAPGNVRGVSISWRFMHNGDVGLPVDMLAFADRSIQVEGTFGAGGNLEIQGSNDGALFRALHDPLGVLLDITAASIRQIMEVTFLMQPVVTAGDGSTSLTVTIFAAGSAARLGTGGSQ